MVAILSKVSLVNGYGRCSTILVTREKNHSGDCDNTQGTRVAYLSQRCRLP